MQENNNINTITNNAESQEEQSIDIKAIFYIFLIITSLFKENY